MSWRVRAALLALFGALLLTTFLAAPTAAALAENDGNVTFSVQLSADGDARWTVRAHFGLESEAEREAFRELAADYRNGETRSLGLPAFRNASEQAAAVTGRQMRIGDVNRDTAPDATIRNGTGWLSVSFIWTNFARVAEDESLVVGDVFNTSTDTWLAGLGPDQTLIITPPESHNPYAGDGVLTERSFRWEGPRTFTAGSPNAEFTPGGTAQPGDYTLPGFLVAGLAALLVVVFVLARQQDVFAREPSADDGGAAPDADTAGTGSETPVEPPEVAAETVDTELLSDEERVERLLEESGGRMKQATIVKETGWSNAKVSQLLSSMEEDGRIDKLRIGRENLISFPDEDVGDFE